MTRVIGQALAVVSITAVGIGAVAFGAPQSIGQETTAPLVFTASQAAAGKAAYSTSCAMCHMPDLSGNNEIPPLAGASFMGTWGSKTTKEIVDYMIGAMPPGGPSLSTEAYTNIGAYILRSNGAAPGSTALNASSEVRIDSVTR